MISKKCEWSACFHGEFSLRCCKDKAFFESPFALHRQLHEKDRQNIDVTPLEEFLRMPMLPAWTITKCQQGLLPEKSTAS